jgi:type II secretory pathway pseudopilin PulG
MRSRPGDQERGLTLIVLVIIIVVTGLIGYSLVTIVSAHRLSAVEFYRSARAFYLAEAALETGKNSLAKQGAPVTAPITNEPLGDGFFDLFTHWEPGSTFVDFTAVGKVGDTRRVISARVYFEPAGGSGFPPGIGLFGKNYFSVSGSGKVYSFDPEAQFPPPTNVALMGPGHIGSSGQIELSGSAVISGQVNVPQSIVDQLAEGDFSNLVGGWSVEVGGRLPEGTTGEEGDERVFDGPRVPAQLQSWSQNPDSSYLGGTPAWPYDPDYSPYPSGYEFDPQWDKNGDDATTPADYDYFVERGGFAAEQGGSTAEIPYTPRDNPTIMVRDNEGLLIPAVEGQGWKADYRIDDDHNFIGTWKELYFTGSRYRFNDFTSGPSQSYHYTGEMDFYVENFSHRGSSSAVVGENGRVVMAVKEILAFTGSSNFNVGGRTDQFQVFTPGETVNIRSTNGSSGAFYAPNAAIDLGNNGLIHAAVTAKSVTIAGSRTVCYPLNYRGPGDVPGGGAGGVILELEAWKETALH